MKHRKIAIVLSTIAISCFSTASMAQSASISQLATQPGERMLDRYLTSTDLAGLQSAAEKGDLAASYLLFVYYDHVATDRQAADRWMAKLANTNTPAGRYAVALAFYRKDLQSSGQKGVEIVNVETLSVNERQTQIAALETIAPQFPKAFALLARIYREGAWVSPDPSRAAKYLQQGAAAGAASASHGLAELIAADGGAQTDVIRLADAAAAAGEPDGYVLGCAVYLELGKSADALARCLKAADQGSWWAQLVTGELLSRDQTKNAVASKYLASAAGATDPAISNAAALLLASLHLKAGGIAQAISALEGAALGNGRAAWLLGRIYLDQRKDYMESEKWLTKAIELQSADAPAIEFDLARAVRARKGDWLVPLKRAADAGHAQAALVLALELMARAPLEAKAYATRAANDPLLAERARQIVAYLDRNSS